MSRLSNDADVIAEAQGFLNAIGVGTQGDAVTDPAAATAGAVSFTGVATTQAGHLSRASVAVDASAGGTAQTTAIVTVPANSIILSVLATITTAFDGDTTQTFEVGITANPDRFIDTADFDPSGAPGVDASSTGGAANDETTAGFDAAAVAVEALWTNDSSASAGAVQVTVIWIQFANIDIADQVDAVVVDLASADVEFDLLVADVAEIRTQLSALLTSLEGGALIAT